MRSPSARRASGCVTSRNSHIYLTEQSRFLAAATRQSSLASWPLLLDCVALAVSLLVFDLGLGRSRAARITPRGCGFFSTNWGPSFTTPMWMVYRGFQSDIWNSVASTVEDWLFVALSVKGEECFEETREGKPNAVIIVFGNDAEFLKAFLIKEYKIIKRAMEEEEKINRLTMALSSDVD
ncbi:hypothetical protein Ccrd_010090 [Cynara cardunculus var. scolymus]|uniref:Uncharacterized protein n=1 Tax=Cynara cardunculus var. scolymus TaxID=59895 RepID=A0A103YLX5_CYNCS|nr:hypothetical protein Ccrd_010090 [Cynara cardunculus var. scolymus]